MTTKRPRASESRIPRTARGTFVKGTPRPANTGRAKGTRNRTTTLLKDAILQAATLVGQDGRGKDGLVGYLKMLAVKERAVYSRLLEKVLPLQLHVQDRTERYTPQEAVERLRERGLPVPPSLMALPGPASVADRLRGGDGSVLHLVEEDYDRELDGEDERDED